MRQTRHAGALTQGGLNQMKKNQFVKPIDAAQKDYGAFIWQVTRVYKAGEIEYAECIACGISPSVPSRIVIETALLRLATKEELLAY